MILVRRHLTRAITSHKEMQYVSFHNKNSIVRPYGTSFDFKAHQPYYCDELETPEHK